MAEFNFNIQNLFEQAFGISPKAFFPDSLFPNPSPSFPDVQVLEVPGTDAKSMLGTPVYTPLVFQGGTDENGEDYEGLDLSQIAPMVSVDRPKRIERSRPTDLESSVKEEIALDDFSVRIRGILINMEAEAKPYDQIERLHNLYNVPDSIEVESELLNRLGIYQLVMHNLQLRNDNAVVNAQPFTIECWHDTPADLVIEEEA